MSSHRQLGWKMALGLAAAAVVAPVALGDSGVVWKTFPAARVTAEAASAQGAAVKYEVPTAAIGDTALRVTCKPSPVSMFALGQTVVVCVAVDPQRLVDLDSRSFKVVVVDTTPPAFSDVPDQVKREASGKTTAVAFPLPKAKDAVSGAVPVTCSPAPGSAFPVGTTNVTCTAKDQAGNTASVAFKVVVVDTAPPTFTGVPDQVKREATGRTTPVTFPLPTAKDAVSVTCSPAPGSAFPLGTTTVTCTAKDQAGNTASVMFKVVVVDTAPPVFSGVPDQLKREASGQTTRVAFPLPKAKDAVSGAVPVTCSPAPGSAFPLGTTDVACTAKDAAGNTANVVFGVSVVDTAAPVFSDAPAVSVEATAARTRVTYDEPRAVDAVDGTVPVACSPASGNDFPVGQATVTCTARDRSGNVATTRIAVSVVDTTPPTLTLPPAATVRSATGDIASSDDPVAGLLAGVVATDLVDGRVTVVNDAPPVFDFGTTTVNFTATDRAGNVARGSLPITVLRIARAVGTNRPFTVSPRASASPAAKPKPVPKPRSEGGDAAPAREAAATTEARAPGSTVSRPAPAVPAAGTAAREVPSRKGTVPAAKQRPRDERPSSPGIAAKAHGAVEGIAAGAAALPRNTPGGPWGFLAAVVIILALVSGTVWAAVREVRRTPKRTSAPAGSAAVGLSESEPPPVAAPPLAPSEGEIVLWHGYGRSRFYARWLDAEGNEQPLAASRYFKENGRSDDATVQAAYAELVEALRAAGWQITASSDRPYEATLRRDAA